MEGMNRSARIVSYQQSGITKSDTQMMMKSKAVMTAAILSFIL
jgi:hypothetical protein